MVRKLVFILLAGVFTGLHINFASAESSSQDLTQLSIEELMNMEVYTASKKNEPYFTTPSATYIITQEDIRRSGANNIPELLRMVPGITVQKINSHSWDISARGFNLSILANKLLVLVDGRAVYTPLFGGVFWDHLDYLLADIDRIEIIRGSGGTLWGANAVNGVINIITKKAKETQGGYLNVGGGTEERDFGGLRYGSRSGDWFYRTYVKYSDRDEGYRSSRSANDAWQMGQGGFKAQNENVTVQGDYYQEYLGGRTTFSSFSSPYTSVSDRTGIAQGANLVSRYEYDNWFLQGFWSETNENFITLRERRDIFDFDFNQRMPLTPGQEFTWGANYRLNLENFNNTDTLGIASAHNLDQLFGTFLQDEISLADNLKFILGSKFEYNIYTHFEFEPNARIAYEINDRNTVWAAVSRAVRTPSRIENSVKNLSGTNAPALFTRILGDSELKSEIMQSYELGYRTQVTDNFLLDATVFNDDYDRLIMPVAGTPFLENGFLVVPFSYNNGFKGDVYGLELSSELKFTQWWKMKGSYTFSKTNIDVNDGVSDLANFEGFLEGATPRHSTYLRSSFDLPKDFEMDATLRYVDNFYHNHVPANTQVDINLSKKIKNWRISVVGQNLLRPHHKESYAGVSTTSTQIERGGYIKTELTF